jgi:hypothetical protein
MMTDQARFLDVTGEHGQHGSATARRLIVFGRRSSESLEPDLAFVGELRGEAIRAVQGV